ncbi:MAG: hypothetical protein IKJ83_04390 [Ruminococcus sp.]|nr:hypothetical protein [Ruminococcus sp.]
MDATQLLISRIEDSIWDYECNKSSFIGFLNEHEASVACSYLRNRGVEYTLFGGYENASRVYLSVGRPVDETQFPITAVLIVSKGKRALTHRDYLGSLMGIGIKRECIGDIITRTPQEAIVFLRSDIVDYTFSELRKISTDTVVLSLYDGDTAEFSSNTENIRIIVSSMRADNIVSALINRSRADALTLITEDKVFVNYFEVKKPSQMLSEGDVLSIRGYGKYIIGALHGTTKRERLVINVLHFI